MSDVATQSWAALREAMAGLSPAPKVEPNAKVTVDRVFTPDSHRAVLDLSRQLVVGNRGMGKSLWTHALTDEGVRTLVANTYNQPHLLKTKVVIGFNGSDKAADVAPTRDSIARAIAAGYSEDDVWKAVIFRAARKVVDNAQTLDLMDTLQTLADTPALYENTLAQVDDELEKAGKIVLILFDALDLLANDWQQLRSLVSSLLKRILGLKSFRSFRAKAFIRPDQYDDGAIFQFADASKLKNDHVDLTWQPHELFGLLFFEMLRSVTGKGFLQDLAKGLRAEAALPDAVLRQSHRGYSAVDEQTRIINALAGPFMGSDARRGRVYTWVPLHLSDARNACSPRTFLTAWQKAAEHTPIPSGRAVDHLGLIEGVRSASTARLEELREDYRWIDEALGALTGQFVPMEREELFSLWQQKGVIDIILNGSWLTPVGLDSGSEAPIALLQAMKSIALMEERANGRINVPDIFRVEAGIKRKGGVAVPRRQL
jgi:hypothetical protein